MVIFLVILYALTVLLSFFLLREYIKEEGAEDGDELAILLFSLLCPIFNIFCSIHLYLDAKNIEIDFEFIIKKIFFIKNKDKDR